jgi:hypothetical protein
MTIAFTSNHFTKREQAIAEIESNGLFLTEANVSAERLIPTPHVHLHSVDIYMLDGILELQDPETGKTHVLKVGCKATVPANAPHAEYSPSGFRAAFGLSVDPKTIMNA